MFRKLLLFSSSEHFRKRAVAFETSLMCIVWCVVLYDNGKSYLSTDGLQFAPLSRNSMVCVIGGTRKFRAFVVIVQCLLTSNPWDLRFLTALYKHWRLPESDIFYLDRTYGGSKLFLNSSANEHRGVWNRYYFIINWVDRTHSWESDSRSVLALSGKPRLTTASKLPSPDPLSHWTNAKVPHLSSLTPYSPVPVLPELFLIFKSCRMRYHLFIFEFYTAGNER